MPRHTPTSPWTRKLIVIAAVLFLANGAVALIGPSLPEPVTYPTREVQLSVELLDEQTADGCVDLLVAGNSMAAHGLSAQRLAEGAGLDDGVVATLPGSIAAVDIDWMERITLPRTRPGTIVYVASPLTFAPQEVVDRYGFGLYNRAVETRGGWPGDLQRWAVDHVPLVRYRSAVVDFEALVDGAEGELPTSYAQILAETGRTVEPDGHIRANGSFGGAQGFLDLLRTLAAGVEDVWDVDEEQVDQLATHLLGLTEEGHTVLLVIPPVSSTLPEVFPDGPEGYAAYLGAARRVAADAGVPAVDLSGAGYGDELFWDTHHLNALGADRFTAEVGRALPAGAAASCTEVP